METGQYTVWQGRWSPSVKAERDSVGRAKADTNGERMVIRDNDNLDSFYAYSAMLHDRNVIL